MKGRAFRAAMGIAALLLAAGAADAACKVEKLADLPVTMDGMKPLVAAKINGVQASFIADSGAFYSMLSPGVAGAAGLKLVPAPPWYRITGMGGDTTTSYTKVKDLTLAGIPLHNIEFFVGGTDTGTAGLLGQNVLGIGDVEYDLPDGFVRLLRSSDCGQTGLAYWVDRGGVYSLLKIETRDEANPHTIATVIVNGAPIKAMFDTGAESSILSLRAAGRAGVKPGTTGVEPAGYSGGLGRKMIQIWTAPIASIKIGDEEIRNVRLSIGDIGMEDVDMLVGADFFISHRVYVDNSAHLMFFTYTGGEVFNRRAHTQGQSAAAVPHANAAAPPDAEGYSRRGAVLVAQHDLEGAIADFGHAIALAPKEPRYLVQRAEAFRADRRRESALADLNKAIDLDPANVPALLDRAEMRIGEGKREAAVPDLDAAARAAPKTVEERLEMAELYESAYAYGPAIEQFDLWILAHREDARLPEALNGRCWVRALANRDLDKALDDCNAALRLRPHNPSFLDSRGLVRVRQGEWDKAIAEYDEVLKVAPKTAWSLYGRGIAKRHKGLAKEGDADIAAAAAIAPELPDRAKALGIS
jgi:tetratricopeptide (TPR) repeat protein/predicted aspartyl protease